MSPCLSYTTEVINLAWQISLQWVQGRGLVLIGADQVNTCPEVSSKQNQVSISEISLTDCIIAGETHFPKLIKNQNFCTNFNYSFSRRTKASNYLI